MGKKRGKFRLNGIGTNIDSIIGCIRVEIVTITESETKWRTARTRESPSFKSCHFSARKN